MAIGEPDPNFPRGCGASSCNCTGACMQSKETHVYQKCPVCGGRGTVPQNFYEPWIQGTSMPQNFQVSCRACGGRGIV